MSDSTMYHKGSRALQDQFDSRRLADQLEQVEARNALTSEDQAFIGRCCMFFLATANTEGHPICSYKGGMPGFVRILEAATLAYPDYDGNGTFRSLGNVQVNPHVAMLFIDFEQQERALVEGIASVNADDPLLCEWPGAQLVIRVAVKRVFSSCPRYIHRMQLVEHSVYVPEPGHTPPVPEWKKKKAYVDLLPRRDRKPRSKE